jgi:DNA-binding NarL/FixJ family response regulator
VTREDANQPVRVLVVEDDRRVRTALRTFLSADGFEVVGDAGDTAAAMRLARDLAPTVALVDVHLPDPTDGLEVLHVLAGLGIPVVAISIHGSVRGRALAAGADEFLEKESAPDRMFAALRDAARRRSPRDMSGQDGAA